MSRTISIHLVLIASIASLATGCLMPKNGPKAGVVPTGQPLAVVDDVKVWTTTYKEKVAEAEYRDADGNKVGTASVYEDRTQVHTMPIWYPVQGSQQLADEDFFRIAGDTEHEQETLAMRENGRKWHKRGIITLGVSVVAMIGSYFVPNPALRTGLVLGTTAGVLGGYYMTYWGAHQMNPETHAVDRSFAERAAMQYNQQLGHVGGLSLNKNF
ncbi:MAG TPA: hypothetical protein VLB44_25955 [Kofleriaceae bacterium]|nr:hypothetical protein [Kofleriaceae bacterium]